MDLKRSLRRLSGLRVSAVNPFLEAVHRRDAENAEVAQRKNPLRMAPFLRAGGVVLVVAVFLILSASSKSHSQSGRQKAPNPNANSNSNTRPGQISKPKNSNSATAQPANTPASSKSDAEQNRGEEATDV